MLVPLAATIALLAPPALPVEFAGHAPMASGPEVVGQWGAPSGLGVVGIHATLLPDGTVLLFDYAGQAGTRARRWDPVTGEGTDSTVPYLRELFCAGHSLLPDGRVFVTGGTVYGSSLEVGVRDTDLYDPATGTWTPGPPMSFRRWYPTNVTLGDGRVLVFSGQKNGWTVARVVDAYDPSSGTIARLPSTADRSMDLYPRLHLLPDGRILWAGEPRGTRLFDPATASWTWVGRMRYGARWEGTSVLLPGLDRVLALGGADGDVATATAEILDLSVPDPAWRLTAPMHFRRRHPNAVVLADGTVLVVGGGRGPEYTQPQRTAELFDPETETWTTMAAQTAGRMYHSTALLLPDGRVLSAGQDHGSLQRTGEVFSPPYLFRGPRPTIAAAPEAVGYGEGFAVVTPDAAEIGRVALVRPGSVTHSVNFEQRYVDLSFAVGDGSLSVVAPPDGNVAPPGWYMLFVLSAEGVPSVASWVRVG